MARREASETVTIRSASRTAVVSLSRQASRPLATGKDQLRMRKRQRVVHGHDQLAHVPDREEAVGGREVHQVDAPTGRRPGPSRSCRASGGCPAPMPPGSALRPRRRSRARIDRDIDTVSADGRSTKTVNSMLGRLLRQRSEQLPREPAESTPIGKAASIDSDFHGRARRWPNACGASASHTFGLRPLAARSRPPAMTAAAPSERTPAAESIGRRDRRDCSESLGPRRWRGLRNASNDSAITTESPQQQ